MPVVFVEIALSAIAILGGLYSVFFKSNESSSKRSFVVKKKGSDKWVVVSSDLDDKDIRKMADAL